MSVRDRIMTNMKHSTHVDISGRRDAIRGTSLILERPGRAGSTPGIKSSRVVHPAPTKERNVQRADPEVIITELETVNREQARAYQEAQEEIKQLKKENAELKAVCQRQAQELKKNSEAQTTAWDILRAGALTPSTRTPYAQSPAVTPRVAPLLGFPPTSDRRPSVPPIVSSLEDLDKHILPTPVATCGALALAGAPARISNAVIRKSRPEMVSSLFDLDTHILPANGGLRLTDSLSKGQASTCTSAHKLVSGLTDLDQCVLAPPNRKLGTGAVPWATISSGLLTRGR